MGRCHLPPRCRAVLFAVVVVAFGGILSAGADEPELIAHWPLGEDARDVSGNGHDGRATEIEFRRVRAEGGERLAAEFDGRNSGITVSNADSLALGTEAFSIAAWIHTDSAVDDVLGDLVSKFDPESRVGFNLGIQSFAGVTSSQANDRHLHFGIDAGSESAEWIDCGRPGENVFVFALCAFAGDLYAGTFEHGADQRGHVYRYAGDSHWVDCELPTKTNAVQALAVFDGHLYAGSGRYLSAGSAMPESPNETPGGVVYRLEKDGSWRACGQLGNDETGVAFTVGGMAVYRGELYAGVSKPAGKGLYRYDGDAAWTYLGNPGHRVTNPVVYNGHLYFCSLDGGGITRFEGDSGFVDLGRPEGVTQTYGFAIHRGALFASSWPNGEVFRLEGGRKWATTGQLGAELEVMPMVVYNGKLYGGTLPLAEVYRYDGDQNWTSTGQLDHTPDVRYRRAWSMAVHGGRLYCGTLPSGHVLSMEAGINATYDHALSSGWVHVAAVKADDRLRIYVNGENVAESREFDPEAYNLANDRPLEIGSGSMDRFLGRLRDLRLYRGALDAVAVSKLAQSSADSR